MTRAPFATVTAAVATPFAADGGIILPALVRHCRWLLDSGCDGLVLFGSNGEAASLTVAERRTVLEQVLKAGVAPGKILVGTGCCAVGDTAELTAHATELGTAGCLIVPPYFFKGISADGIRRYYGGVATGVKAKNPSLFLYHIPKVSGVPLGAEVTAQIVADNGNIIAGYKDSDGDWANTEAVLKIPGLHVYVGAETQLLNNLRHGGAGCISGSANANPGGIRAVADAWKGGDAAKADAAQAEAARVRKLLEQFPLTPSVKYALSAIHKDADWKTMRPPLHHLSEAQGNKLLSDVAELL